MSIHLPYPLNIHRLDDYKSRPDLQNNNCYRLLWLDDGSGLIFLQPYTDLSLKLIGSQGWAILFGERQYSRFKNHYAFYIPFLENKLAKQQIIIPLKKQMLSLLETYTGQLKYTLDQNLSPLKAQTELNQLLKVSSEAYDQMQSIMTGLSIGYALKQPLQK